MQIQKYKGEFFFFFLVLTLIHLYFFFSFLNSHWKVILASLPQIPAKIRWLPGEESASYFWKVKKICGFWLALNKPSRMSCSLMAWLIMSWENIPCQTEIIYDKSNHAIMAINSHFASQRGELGKLSWNLKSGLRKAGLGSQTCSVG